MSYDKISVHAGHNPDGKVRCGTQGIIKESTEAREVTKRVIKLLQKEGISVRDCTCNNGTGKTDVLNKIRDKCRAFNADLNVSIHFNAFNGSAHGVEVLYKNYDFSSLASRISSTISKRMGVTNRGPKRRTGLKFLNDMKKSILIECCFCDNKGDVSKYNRDRMAEAIVSGLLGKEISSKPKEYDTVIAYSGDIDKIAAGILNWELKKAKVISSKDYKNMKAKKLIGIGGPVCKELKCTKEIVGDDRFDTIQKTLDYVKDLKKEKANA